MSHPAIQRGRYEVQTFNSGRVGASGRVRMLPAVSILVRVVDYDSALAQYLDNTPEGQGDGKEIDTSEFVQLVAPFLREGLLDPGNGRKTRWLQPVHMIMRDSRLSFIQPVGCMN